MRSPFRTSRNYRFSNILFILPWILLTFFLIGMAALYWILEHQEQEEHHNAFLRDVYWVLDSIRVNLQANNDLLNVLARDVANHRLNVSGFNQIALHGILVTPETMAVLWLDEKKHVAYFASSPGLTKEEVLTRLPQMAQVQEEARRRGAFVYSKPFLNDKGEAFFEAYVPIFRGRNFKGTMVAVYAIDIFMRYVIPSWFIRHYGVELVDTEHKIALSSNLLHFDQSAFMHEEEFIVPFPGATLRIYKVRQEHMRSQALRVILVPLLLGLVIIAFLSISIYNKRLQEAEDDRNKILNLSMAILCILNRQGVFIRVNPAFESMFGSYNPDLHGSLVDLVHPDYRESLSREMEALVHGDLDFVSFESVFVRSNGDPIWLKWEINSNPGDQFLYAAAYDVTLRRMAEEALREEMAFRRSIEYSMVTGMFGVDLDLRIMHINQAFTDMSGWCFQDIQDKALPFPFFNDEDNRLFEKYILNEQKYKNLEGIDFQLIRSDHSVFDARLYISPLIDSAKSSVGWLAMIVDVTEQKKTRHELEIAYIQFVTVLDSIEAAISVCDEETRELLFINAFYRRYFGDRAEPHIISLNAILSNTEQTEGNILSGEIYLEENRAWFDVRARIIQWVDGRLVWMVVASDVTERKRAEEFYRHHQEKMQKTSHLITMGEMASSLAHELNQPLAAVTNYSTGCIKRISANTMNLEDVSKVLNKIAVQADRAGRIIRSIRDFVKKSEPRFSNASLVNLVDDVVELIMPDVEKRGFVLQVSVQPDLPSTDLDVILVQQVILNLIKNAMDASGNAEEKVITFVAKVNQDGNALFSVSDRGCGIDPNIIDKLFNPFFTTKPDGMGMGLNICRSIIEYHKGRLWVTDNPGGGSVFSFTLPIEQKDET